jgi:hypothetical protein
MIVAAGLITAAGLLCWPGCSSRLREAVSAGDVEEVRQLARGHPSWVNARDKYGCTPLHYAVFRHRVDMVNVLLEAGADPEVTDAKALATPLQWATASLGRYNEAWIQSQAEFMRQQGRSPAEAEAHAAKLRAIHSPQAKAELQQVIAVLQERQRAGAAVERLRADQQ